MASKKCTCSQRSFKEMRYKAIKVGNKKKEFNLVFENKFQTESFCKCSCNINQDLRNVCNVLCFKNLI